MSSGSDAPERGVAAPWPPGERHPEAGGAANHLQDLAAECARLRRAAAGIADHSPRHWRDLWERVGADYRAALERNHELIARQTGLAPQTLRASVDKLLSGLDPASLRPPAARTRSVSLVILAASVPALAAQPLFPLLASGSAVILKPSAREPDSACLLLEVLQRIDPVAAQAVTLMPGLRLDRSNADLSGLDRVVAYGDDATVMSIAGELRHSVAADISPQGHGWSASYLAAESVNDEVLEAVARDIALFDQRGCLCPQVVLTAAPAAAVVAGLGEALLHVAEDLPPSPATANLAALRGLRDSAAAAGRVVSEMALTAGLAVERNPQQPIEATPGGRSVWVYGEQSMAEAVDLLRPVRDRLQSLAVATPEASRPRARSAFTSLRVSRIVRPGELHAPGFDWVTVQLGLA